MLQFRMKEGGDSRFYNPDRDFVYCWPKALQKALQAFNDFEGDAECTKEEMFKAASHLGKMTADIIRNPTLPNEIAPALNALEDTHPNAMPKIRKALFYAVFSVWTGWTMDVRPKSPTDAPIPTASLEELAFNMAKASFVK